MFDHYFNRVSPGTITVAACENLQDARAMMRWIMPVLADWPRKSWNLWLVDAADRSNVRAAKAGNPEQVAEWQDVDTSDFPADGQLCRVLTGSAALVLFAPDVVATEVSRALDGLVVSVVSFPTSDPLAKPFKRSFASFGVIAGY